jgi:hypothetical protein
VMALMSAMAAPSAFAASDCNAGGGNGGEYYRVWYPWPHYVECDPGNSAGHNHGGG